MKKKGVPVKFNNKRQQKGTVLLKGYKKKL